MSTDAPPPVYETSWRLRSLEQRVGKLEDNRPEVLAERVAHQGEEITALRLDIISLKRALYTFALSISASAVAFGVAVLQLAR